MPDTPVINTEAGQTVSREQMILYMNTATAATPTWSPLGKRVEDSSIEFDWSDETIQDVLGNTYSSMKKPVMTQSFDPYLLDSEDAAISKIVKMAVQDHDAQGLCNIDLLLVHFYQGATATPFAERYPSSMVKPSGLGGEGGGNIEMPLDVTFGGERQKGTAAKDNSGVVTFTPAA